MPLTTQQSIQAIRKLLKASGRDQIRVELHMSDGSMGTHWTGEDDCHKHWGATPELLAEAYSGRIVNIKRGEE